ncbi:unnamed protein product [Microthlaspi erraticum]|uniref:DUF4408 domain-containing protein n=1 Tax=Microthlaspi erraticum TaxID=1685480 RepID=A0A6D2K1Y1_9BRAS|nr:unnamed protein product [Microthlaspi erraticum]
MAKPLESHGGVEAEKAEAMRRYNSRRSFRYVLRGVALASLCYLWFPTVAISLQTAGDCLYRTAVVVLTNRSVVFVFANLIVALIFVLSRDRDDDESSSVSTAPDLYDRYTSFSAVNVTASAEKLEDDERSCSTAVPDQNTTSSAITVTASADEKVEDYTMKQIVPAFFPEVVVEAAVSTDVKGIYRRTKSEVKKESRFRPVAMEYRRTESANSALERLSSEEFRLKVETFIMEKKRSLVQELEIDCRASLVGGGGGGGGGGGDSGYGSC